MKGIIRAELIEQSKGVVAVTRVEANDTELTLENINLINELNAELFDKAHAKATHETLIKLSGMK